ncbi:MAG: hypothetical protein JXB03_04600 [Spirochaetales bacterium]|nr:hypothetical protein [Spirochaetales bacterium]
MKKCAVFCVLFAVSLPVLGQGLYFDIGVGAGLGTLKLDGTEFENYDLNEKAVDIGMKLGCGPIAGMPVYVAAALEGMGHRFSDDYNYIQFNSYVAGPSLIVYPFPHFQIAATAGYSFTANDSDIGEMYNSESGFGGSVSAAMDIGSNKHGLLVGAKYYLSITTLEESGAEQHMSLMALFVRYAYRTKL